MTSSNSIHELYDFSNRFVPAAFSGFSGTEPIGRWSDNDTARTRLRKHGRWPSIVDVTVDLRPYVEHSRGPQVVTIEANGRTVGEWAFTNHFTTEKITFQIELAESRQSHPLDLVFHISNPVRPADLEPGADGRLLGIMVERIAVSGTLSGRPRNAYSALPDYCFWNKSVANADIQDFDPVVAPRFTISATDKVGTAGSCFAQHISRRIQASGFNYLVTESGDNLPVQDRAARNYGTFSARYGNIYTPAQLLQLWEEAFEGRRPAEPVWQRHDGRYIDPVRQQIEPAGFATEAEVMADRERHLNAVRKMFDEVDVFVFTLGLTEAWFNQADGSLLSAAPGVVGNGSMGSHYGFINYDIFQTWDALDQFLQRFHAHRPNAKVLLTVSPVPLMATYENRSVVTSTTYSKSVLRVASEQAIKKYDWVDYFPSYEIITQSPTGGLYFGDDYREVNARGVSHAMRCFLNNYLDKSQLKPVRETIFNSEAASLVCDEEVLAQVRA